MVYWLPAGAVSMRTAMPKAMFESPNARGSEGLAVSNAYNVAVVIELVRMPGVDPAAPIPVSNP
jgi:hypothetical protein